MFASTVLNYMDRQAMSLVGPQIKAEFHLRNVDFGWVLAVFQLTYAVFQVPAGYLADRWDVRKTYAGAVAFWSMAGMAAAFSPGLGVLLILRALLGVGESFNWPCALRVTGRILPASDRSLGNGIFNSGAAVGAVVTPITVTLLTNRFGWRTSFVVIGSLGFVWVAGWLAVLRGPRRDLLSPPKPVVPNPEWEDLPAVPSSSLSTAAQCAYGAVVATAVLLAISAYWQGLAAIWWAIAWLMFGILLASLVLPTRLLAGSDWAGSLGQVVRMRRFWIMAVVSVSINVCWHFLVSWMPTYLKEDRGMTFLASGLWTAVPFLAADVGNLGGGALSRMIAGRGFGAVRARTVVMTFCTLLVTCGAWVGLVESNMLVIVLLGVMAMGTAAFMANFFAFAQEVSSRHTGLIVGILGGLGNLCAAGILPLAGMVKDTTGGFGPIFVLVGLLPFLGLGALIAGWGREAIPGSKSS
jgi:MFS transporter, ACS family, hexuronate transporter